MSTLYLPFELLRAQSWTNSNFDTLTTAGPYGFTADSDGTGAGTAKATIPTSIVKGLQYIITYNATVNSGSGTVTVSLTDSAGSDISNTKTFTATGTQKHIFTATQTDAAGFIQFSTPESTTINFTVDSVRARHIHNISPSTVRLSATVIAGKSISPFTGQQQTYIHRGQYWELDLSIPAMPLEYAKLWQTFFFNLNSQENDFYYRPINQLSSSGVITSSDTLIVNGAQSAQSTDLDITGPTSTAGLLELGDYLEVNSQLIQVRGGTLDSDGSGDLTINIWPYVRDAISDTTPVYFEGPRGLFRLSDSSFSITKTNKGIIDGFTITARESF